METQHKWICVCGGVCGVCVLNDHFLTEFISVPCLCLACLHFVSFLLPQVFLWVIWGHLSPLSEVSWPQAGFSVHPAVVTCRLMVLTNI